MTVHVVPPAQWGMPTPADNHTVRGLAVVIEANVHHSATAAPLEHDPACAGQVRAFDRDHRSQGWACIGYHRVICPHGYVFLGRPLSWVPAAAKDHNEPIIAYCLIAFGDDRATPAQLAALVEIRAADARTIGHPLAWTTHREVEPPGYTVCPGDGIEEQVRRLRADVGRRAQGFGAAAQLLIRRVTRLLRRRRRPLSHPASVLLDGLDAASAYARKVK